MGTPNKFLVGANVTGRFLVILHPLPSMIPRVDALNLAAWIVALADDGTFENLLKAVKAT